MSRRGLFVTLEGIDRSGKSTHARLLAESLGPSALAVREPGGTELGERVRGLVKDPSTAPSPQAEALLFAAARSQLVSERVEPGLARGLTVVCDRFLDSSLAYQGAARGLGVDAVRAINRFGIGDLKPDLTLLLDLDPLAAGRRAGDLDRFEAEGLRWQRRVRDAYRALARADPARWRVIEADRHEAFVHAEALELVKRALSPSND
ncbi:MAG: dTMP kinase [Actinomycetota bacterium]|nr:dTMP kinase [Actinomycetota bacterium]MDQ3648071.1 dTMP kinase [Actinomycetota bacterium]